MLIRMSQELSPTGRAFYIGSASLFNFGPIEALPSGILATNSGVVKSLCRSASSCTSYGARAPGNGSFVFACKENPAMSDCPIAALEAVAISLGAKYPTTKIEIEIVTNSYLVGSLGGWPGPMNPKLISSGPTAMMEKYGSVLYVVPTSGALSPAKSRVVVDNLRKRSLARDRKTRKKRRKAVLLLSDSLNKVTIT